MRGIQVTAPLRGSAACDAGAADHAADRGECAASADKADVGARLQPHHRLDASEQVAERVKAFTNRGRGSFNRRITTARLPIRRGHQAQPEGRLRLYAPVARHTRARRTTTPPLPIAPRRSGSIRNMAGPTTTVASPTTVCMNTTLRWPTTPRRSGSIPGTCGPMPAAAWRGRSKGEFDQAVADITRRSQSIRNTPLVSAKGVRRSSGRG